MRIFIRPSHGSFGTSATAVRTRLAFALGRFAGRVRSVSVHLTDLRDPRGGHDTKCLIAVRLTRSRRVVVIEDVDADPAVAVGRAVERTSRAVSRAVQYASDWRHPQQRH